MKRHQSAPRPEVSTREALPRVKEEKGGVILQCPFCEIPHPVSIGKDSPCGTTLRVTAVQTIIPKRTVNKRGLKCIKCGQGGGEMVPFNNGFIHLIECMPGVKLMTQAPEHFSRMAKLVYRLPPWARRGIEKRTGVARQIDEIDPEGRETGKTLGYIFHRGA